MATTVNNSTGINFTALNSALSGTSSSSGASGSAQAMQDQFMQLLVAQLQNQDPTNPMDNSQMTSQLAQISTVSGLQQLNATMTGMSSLFNSSQALQSASLIGKQVMAPTSSWAYDGTNNLQAAVDVPAGTTQMQVSVVSLTTGQVVDQMTTTPTAGQSNPINWDGTLADGTKAAAGKYAIVAKGVDASGNQSSLTVDGWQTASSVILNGSAVQVVLGNGSTVNLSDIKQVSGGSSTSST
ncbi:flagellar hook assembly protein FlgD [Silvimonas iriomotensis]|uniref:Basal-body rod modification protein FlgD n=1 Tax=Silvimonas iriomotensis TaxID=449662 RepID=A0ABQ2P4T6_9NEIS|nr:flagellar hook capping FlgD N-terminal domain-containing protein [Silvimonas iriomotensis]GGP18256.1 basal-body rod modification protein FlgD [Silvimonas iriomotensis]